MGSVDVVDVAVEHRDGFGIGTAEPRLSWRVVTDTPNWWQASSEIEIDGERHAWNGDDSVLVPWPAPPLRSRERLTVRVRVRGRDGSTSAWSAPLEVEAGLLHASDWEACFTSPHVPLGGA